jgi:hypothetical protein
MALSKMTKQVAGVDNSSISSDFNENGRTGYRLWRLLSFRPGSSDAIIHGASSRDPSGGIVICK